ncbi:MAG: hypothetical protein R3D89_14650 [Sphingomonadaceae bacterium]
MNPRYLALALLVPSLSACVSSGSGATVSAPAYRAPTTVRAPTPQGARDPRLDTSPGLEGVIGASESQLVGQFGTPRLNVWEGDARKLQFSGTACVLDIFLYPTSQSPAPVATWVEARRASDGKDVDKSSCVRALRGGR